jgi:hypothetical protein
MKLITSSEIKDFKINYYDGFDLERILNHPDDGRDGIMVVFFDSIKEEEIKHNRNEKIKSLLESKKIKDFSDIMDKLNNNYLMLYQTHGFTDVVFKSIKNKLENIKDINYFEFLNL